MTHHVSAWLDRLALWLPGTFENREQALEDPTWYVGVRLWHRSIGVFGPGHLGIYAEQASAPTFAKIYRPRVFQISPTSDPDFPLAVAYFALRQPERWRGGGLDPAILEPLTLADLEPLPGCLLPMAVLAEDAGFRAQLPPDRRCCFQADGQLRQVSLGFEVRSGEFLSYDKGIDPDTGKPIWGAIMGPFRYRRVGD